MEEQKEVKNYRMSISEERLDATKLKMAEDFLKANILPKWADYSAVKRFKSVRRAIRRGHVDLFTGAIYPKRPFSNKKATKGRAMNEEKKRIYEQLKHRQAFKRGL